MQEYLAQNPCEAPSRWFAVYRPCSRDSIAKMLGRVGVGKGLNVKGKSAKKNRLSGFVPFVQISDNSHKSLIEECPVDARTEMYYRNNYARERALVALQNALDALIKQDPTCIQVMMLALKSSRISKGSLKGLMVWSD